MTCSLRAAGVSGRRAPLSVIFFAAGAPTTREIAPANSQVYTPGNSWLYILESPMTESQGSAAEIRALTKWYLAARVALSHNRPLTTSATSVGGHQVAADLSAAEAEALRGIGAFKDDAPIRPDNDPLIRSQAQYIAVLEESFSAAEAAKLLRVDVSRVRQRLREHSLFGIEHEGAWRLPRFQFERRFVIPGLASVLKALPADLFPLDVIDWFALPDSDLQLDSDPGPLSPREWLLAGRPVAAVVALAGDLTSA